MAKMRGAVVPTPVTKVKTPRVSTKASAVHLLVLDIHHTYDEIIDNPFLNEEIHLVLTISFVAQYPLTCYAFEMNTTQQMMAAQKKFATRL